MSNLSKKLLVSGCGISWSGQERPTWVKLFKLAGADIIDVGGPGVSNQWILNQTFLKLQEDTEIKVAIVQLTAIGKLDVEVDADRIGELVKPDSLRNFVHHGIWPSSASLDHAAKQLWNRWLYSPGLELEDIFCKLILLKSWCQTNGVELTVVQGYALKWETKQVDRLKDIITDIYLSISEEYENSPEYALRTDDIGVPCLPYQLVIANYIARLAVPEIVKNLAKVEKILTNK
jgi:hypothetical protein